MKKILLIGTGGTIACQKTPDGLKPVLTTAELLKYIPSVQEFCTVDVLQICNLDSSNMSPVEWSRIAQAIRDHYDHYDGFVVTHGTDTMAYTSAALSYMIQNSRKPVVITGSQLPINSDTTDAKKNITDSILFACDDLSHDVSLIFDGQVIAGTRAKKMMARSFNAFRSVNFPVLAIIRDQRVIRYLPYEPVRKPVRFYPEFDSSTCVVKLVPGIQKAFLAHLFDHCSCIILESFGVGGIPESLQGMFYEKARNWRAQGKCIVVTTQVINEGSDMRIYQVGRQIKEDLGILESYDMTLEAAYTKMMWLNRLCGQDYDKKRELFYTPVNHDILCAEEQI